MITMLEVQLNYGALAPLIILFAAAAVGVLIEGVIKQGLRDEAQMIVAALGLLGALAMTIQNWRNEVFGVRALGSVTTDGPTYFIWALLLVVTILAMLLMSERRLNKGTTNFTPMASSVPGSANEAKAFEVKHEHTEVYPLVLFSTFGMMLFASANDFITMFVALEVFSLPLYLLSGMARRRRLLSQEAALKYFLLGSLTSAIFLYGTALLYGFSGSLRLSDLATAIQNNPDSSPALLYGGTVLVLVGLLFKIGAVPFHAWTPDVYMGAPTQITAYMAVATKAAAVVAMLRVLFVGLGAIRWDWQPVVAALAVLTMLVGSVVALSQSDIKRLLAYSSIAHAGFLLVAIAGAVTPETHPNASVGSVASILFYLTAYGLATLGAFAIVMMVRKAGGEANNLAAWTGLGRKHPFIAALMTLFMLSFAGIPLTGGFIGKLQVFLAGWAGGYAWLVLVAVLMSLVAAFFYLRVVVVMFFREPGVEAEGVTVDSPSWMTWTVIIVCALGTLALGLWSEPLAELAISAAEFLR
ncbi:NADH-quinone oxidoreductase subunit NuoN [Propionibacteriaceae bacterium Y1923]|uniref:NADH-quinone oxidoreductase subunit NuoN n=1 Tax=Aestuariimicrobium sp. Y1814 TaxID=3418742 RepID=UPI003C22FFAE